MFRERVGGGYHSATTQTVKRVEVVLMDNGRMDRNVKLAFYGSLKRERSAPFTSHEGIGVKVDYNV